MSFDLHLTGLRAVVTGGTLGLGAAVVKPLVDAGARVATSARRPSRQTAGSRRCDRLLGLPARGLDRGV
jgi:NAD(P)-dependent dehydrogenase (short-subunit alcohol dehydrogenase family)